MIFKAVAGMVFDRKLSHALPVAYQLQGSSSMNWRLLSLIEPLSLRIEVLTAVALAIQVGYLILQPLSLEQLYYRMSGSSALLF